MTVSNTRCDRCGLPVTGAVEPQTLDLPADSTEERDRRGIRFSYHPGEISLRDDSGILCAACWREWTEPLGEPTSFICAICGKTLTREESLFVRAVGAKTAWQLCDADAVDLLNQLDTVNPPLDKETFHLPLRPPGTATTDRELPIVED